MEGPSAAAEKTGHRIALAQNMQGPVSGKMPERIAFPGEQVLGDRLWKRRDYDSGRNVNESGPHSA